MIMKKYLYIIFLIFSLLMPLIGLSQGAWNLVWREDFGVAEDTVILDFADDSKKIIAHTCASSVSECTTINDMYYGIANSTWWAYNRKKSCKSEAWHFQGGRDHTGNEKGAMLIVNVGNESMDKTIYEQNINFDLCQNKNYRFVIYAASITNPGYCDANPTLANLTMNVYNIKDPSNPILVKTVETGDIPLWEMPKKADGSDDNGNTGSGYANPFAERKWSEFKVDFVAGDGDKLKLEVVNHKNGGCGNDFVIDDISLYRYDDKEVLDPFITTSTVSQESTTSATGCAFVAKFSVPTEVLDAWKDIYSQVYFLWQRSVDGGVTWNNMNSVSGIDKTVIEWEVPTDVTEIYRVIITGSTSSADAKTEAEYIAQYGGPQDGCSYYSISNTLAGVSPVADCSLKENLKTIWKEDFGVIDKTLLRTNPIVKLNSYSEPGNQFKGNDYVITSDPYTAIGPQKNPTCYYDCDQKKLEDYYSHVEGDAVLYTRLLSGQESTVVEKTIAGPFCNCKNYIFSFKTITLSSWTDMEYSVLVQAGSGNTLVSDAIKVGGSGSPEWKQFVYSFVLPFDYTGNLTVKVISKGKASWNVPVAFDDFRVSICQETVPQAVLCLDNVESKKYISGFDCAATPVHIANLINLDDWASQFPNYGYVWQMSTDGVSWITISEATKNHYCEDLEDGETLFRVVIGETKAVAQQVATNGKPTNPCATYFITNSVGLFCKGVKCETPADVTITCSDSDEVLCVGETASLTPTKQVSATQFAQEWYKDGVIISGYPKTTDQAVYTVSDAGTYTIKVYDVENPTLEKCSKTAEIEIKTAERPTVTISGTADYCEEETVMPATFTFTGTAPYTFTYSDGTTTSSNITSNENTYSPAVPTIVGTKTYTVSALKDSYCTATTTTGSATITIKPIPTAVASIDGSASVCAGTAVTLKGSSNQSSASFSWTGPNGFSSSIASPVLTNTTTAMSGDYSVTTTLNGCSSSEKTTLTVNAIPTLSDITASETAVCSGTEIIFSATASDSGVGTATWTTDETTQSLTSNGLTASLKKTVSNKETIKVSLNYSSSAGCVATEKTKTITINSIPAAPIVEDLSYCINASANPLSATATGTLSWFDGNKTAIAGTPTPSTTSPTTLTYYAKQTEDNCVSDFSNPLKVTINSKITPTISLGSTELCAGKTASVELAQTFKSVSWSGDASSYFDDALTAATQVFTAPSVSADKSYTIKVDVVDANDCEGSNTATIIVHPLPTATISASSSSICNLTSTTLTAVPSEVGGTGVWTNAVESTETTAIFTGTTAKTETISYVYTSKDNCVQSVPATTIITVNAIPQKPVTETVKYCKNATDVSTLTATAEGTLTWYDENKAKLPSVPKPSVMDATTTTYYVTQTVNDCESDFAQLDVIVNPLPTPVISSSEDAVCEGTPIAMSLNQTYASQTWTCLPENVLNSTTLASPTIQATALAGTYSIGVVVKDANGCEGIATDKSVIINAIPTVELSNLTNQCESVNDAQTITATIKPDGILGTGTWGMPAVKTTETTAAFTPSVAGKGDHTITYDFESSAHCVAEQVTKTVTVYENPDITLTPSKSSVCKGGTNSDEVTMRTTGTVTTGTFVYSSPTLTGIQATSGSFLPENEIAGKHSIKLQYTDGNNCSDEIETEVEIHARPVSDITANPTEICDYAQPITLTAKVNGSGITDGVFAGTGVSGKIFTPSTQIKGANTITYNYVDANECSAEEVSMTLLVHHTEQPEVVPASASKLDVTNQTEVPVLMAIGDNIKWYAENDTSSAVKSTGESYIETFIPDGDGKMEVGTYTAYATQTQNGCQSTPKEVTLTITDCVAKAPTGSSYHACVNDDSDVEATAISNQTGADNFCWFTDRFDIPTGTVASLSEAQSSANGSGATFTIVKSLFTEEKTITVYVAEYYEADHCFSAATPVIIDVHARPVPTITNPGSICSTTGEIAVSYAPTTGGAIVSILSAENGTITDNSKWSVYFDATQTSVTDTKLKLTTVETWGATKECVSEVEETFTVTHVLAPKGTGIGTPQVWSSTKLESLPVMDIDYASGLGAILSVKDETNTEIATSSPVVMTSEITGEGEYQYEIKQTLNGCSALAISKWNIVECPTVAPNPESKMICAGDPLPTIDAQGTGANFQWYDESNQLIGTTAILDISTLAGYVSTKDMDTKVYKFSVSQDGDDGAGGRCFGPKADVSITVNALPKIEIEDIPILCYDGTEYEVKATVDGQPATNGLWKIEGETNGISASGIISPNFKDNSADGDFSLKYTYTNATTSCTNEEDKTFHIEYVETPNPTNFNGILTDPKVVELAVSSADVESSASFNWYESKTAISEIFEGELFTTSDDPAIEVSKSYWVEKQIGECVSERAESKVTIVDCPWTVQTVIDATACQNSLESMTTMSATAPAEATIQSWKWLDENNTIVSTTDSYKQTNVSTNGTYSYKVQYEAYEPTSGKYCWSVPADVKTIVYKLPEITFDQDESVVCYTTPSERIAVTVDYGTNGEGSGLWSVTGDASAISNSGIFYPQTNGEMSGNYTITYSYTDAKSCKNTASRNISVIYLSQPVTTDFYGMTSQKNPVKISATAPDYADLKWFTTDNSTTNAVGEGSLWATGDAYDKLVNKNYYARQTKDGCFSEPAIANVHIVDCPIPSVTISDESACDYEDIPTLSATTNDWSERNASLSSFNYYTSETASIPEYSSTDGLYQPAELTSDVTTYFVTEYNSIPLNGLSNEEGCESQRVKVKLTKITTDVPTISSSIQSGMVCFGDENPTMIATNFAGDVLWFENDPDAEGEPTSVECGSGMTFVPSEEEVGEHTVWALQLANGCYSKRTSVSFMVKPIPGEPTTQSAEICYGDNPKEITAEGENNAVIVWYDNNSSELLRGNKVYASKEIFIGTYSYYASQIVDGCEGPKTLTTYLIKPLPSVPVVLPQNNICEYDEAPLLTASGENIVWYASDKLSKIGEGESYSVDDMSIGMKRFYASQTVDGCEGEMTPISFSVNSKPSNPIVIGASMCQGDTLIPSLETNLNIDKWYADNNATMYLTTGYHYTPVESQIDASLTMYVQREQNGCLSEIVPVVLNVIPQPNFSIGEDIIACVYDSIRVIQAMDFEPPITENSYIGWNIEKGRNSVALVDNMEHNIQPVDVISETGTYTISAFYRYKYDNVSCNSQVKTISYEVKKRARTPIVFSNVICKGAEIKDLRALGSPNMVWQSLSGVKPTFYEGTKYKFETQDLDTGMYLFEIYDRDVYDTENNLGCESLHDTISMTVAPAAQTKLFGVDSVCVSATEQYYTQYTKGSNYMWNVTGGNLNYAKDMSSTSVRYVDWLNAGIDTIMVYEQTWAGCEGFDTLVVRVAPVPKASFTMDLPGASNKIELTDATIQDSLWYKNDDGELVAEPIMYTMEWNYGYQGEDPTIVDTIVDFEHRYYPFVVGNYTYGYNCPTLTVVNTYGCTDVNNECIFVNVTSSLFVPTAFSPTNPAHTVRQFGPKGYNLKTCEISVYDKWGNLLWFSNEVKDGMFVGMWDGTYDGKMMQSDVYIWKMEATFLDGQTWEGFDAGNNKKTKFGSVTLIR